VPAYYTVVQCVPDPIADERINVGIVVFGDGQLSCRFLRNWDRVARFAQEDIGYVREFADRIQRAALESAGGIVQPMMPGFPSPRRLDEETLRLMIGEWSNSIQFTPIQPSLESPDTLLPRLVDTFLREPVGQQPRFRDRQDAARLAVGKVREAVVHRVGATEAQQFVKANYQVGGKVVPRLRLDLAVKNGRVYVASRALSFETHDMPELDEQMRDAIYTLRDVGDFLKRVSIDLVVLPPRPGQRRFREAQDRFREVQQSCRQIGARLVLEEETTDWSEEIAALVETEIVRHGDRAAHG
jgi:hypothetical protein